jgi:hypothetical protein
MRSSAWTTAALRASSDNKGRPSSMIISSSSTSIIISFKENSLASATIYKKYNMPTLSRGRNFNTTQILCILIQESDGISTNISKNPCPLEEPGNFFRPTITRNRLESHLLCQAVGVMVSRVHGGQPPFAHCGPSNMIERRARPRLQIGEK